MSDLGKWDYGKDDTRMRKHFHFPFSNPNWSSEQLMWTRKDEEISRLDYSTVY